jgi:hypothetical protein
MPKYLDNPAGRLAALIRNMLEGGGLSLPVGTVLGIPEDQGNAPLIVSLRLLDIQRLAVQTRREVEALPPDEDPEFLLSHFDAVDKWVSRLVDTAVRDANRLCLSTPVRSLFATGSNKGDADQARFRLPKEALYSLDACSRALHRQGTGSSLSDAEVPDLVERVRELIDLVVDSEELPGNAKIFLIGRLRDVEAALLASRIYGYEDLEAALDRLVGGLARRDDVRKPSVMTRVRGLLEAFSGATQEAAVVAEATYKTVEAIETIASSTGISL